MASSWKSQVSGSACLGHLSIFHVLPECCVLPTCWPCHCPHNRPTINHGSQLSPTSFSQTVAWSLLKNTGLFLVCQSRSPVCSECWILMAISTYFPRQKQERSESECEQELSYLWSSGVFLTCTQSESNTLSMCTPRCEGQQGASHLWETGQSSPW